MNKSETHVTPNFLLSEFVVSDLYPDIAKRINLTYQDEIKLYQICSTILQPVREKYGPVMILSGKRSEELNNKIPGASKTSDHLFHGVSCAVDFTLKNHENLDDCFQWITNVMPFGFGQLRYYKNRKFIHVSLPTPKHQSEAVIV